MIYIYIHVSADNLADVVHPDQNYWNKKNNIELKKALQPPNTGVAKNLVLAIGDGMGVTTTTGERSQLKLYHRYRGLINLKLSSKYGIEVRPTLQNLEVSGIEVLIS